MRFSKLIVSSIIVLNIIFAIAILAVFWHTSSEPTVLVGSWFAWTTGELWALSKIKRSESEGILPVEDAENNGDEIDER